MVANEMGKLELSDGYVSLTHYPARHPEPKTLMLCVSEAGDAWAVTVVSIQTEAELSDLINLLSKSRGTLA